MSNMQVKDPEIDKVCTRYLPHKAVAEVSKDKRKFPKIGNVQERSAKFSLIWDSTHLKFSLFEIQFIADSIDLKFK